MNIYSVDSSKVSLSGKILMLVHRSRWSKFEFILSKKVGFALMIVLGRRWSFVFFGVRHFVLKKKGCVGFQFSWSVVQKFVSMAPKKRRAKKAAPKRRRRSRRKSAKKAAPKRRRRRSAKKGKKKSAKRRRSRRRRKKVAEE